MSEYPKTLVHPNHRKGSVSPIAATDPNSGRQFLDYQGTPDVLPPVTVNNIDQEEQHRAKGYVTPDEKQASATFQEYPMWLKCPGKNDVLVRSVEEEEACLEKGYARPGLSDPEAIEREAATPYVPNQVHNEYPKYVDGLLVDPEASKSSFQEYPKWVGEVLVNNRVEEDRLILGTQNAKANDETDDDEKERLKSLATQMGIAVDGRWSLKRLREVVVR